MKRIFTFLIMFVLAGSWQIFGQTSLDLNFDDGQTKFAVINKDANNPSFALSATGGILKIEATKKSGDWSFLQIWDPKLNLSTLPTLQFSVKTNANCNFVVKLKSPNLSDPTKDVQIDKTVSLVAGNDFQFFFIDLTNDIAATANFDKTHIKEIQVDCSAGFASAFIGTVELDYLKIGLPKEVQAKGIGYTETFNTTDVPAGVITNAKHSFSMQNNALKVDVNRDIRWLGFNYELDGAYDISANPFVNVKISTETDMVLQMFLIDANGNGYLSEQVGTQYKYDELVSGKNEFRSARIYKGGYNTVTFDFTNAKTTIVDLKKITKIKFISNGTALTFKGKYLIDEIKLGDQASKMAYVGQIPQKAYAINSVGTKEVIVPEIKNASELKVSGAGSLINNPTVSAITYSTPTENGIKVQYGFAKINYTIKADVTGTDTLTVEAVGATGFLNNTMKFAIVVKSNIEPTINAVDDIVVKTGAETTIKLAGITNGNPEADQKITITATSDNTAVLDAITVNYATGNHYGNLVFATKSEGVANVTISVKDDAGAEITELFMVCAFKALNNEPKINVISKLTATDVAGQQTVVLRGISDGDNSNQTLTISASSSDTSLFADPVVNYVQGRDSAILTFTPKGKLGNASIVITVADNGGNADNDGNKSTTANIPVNIIQFNPTGYEFDLGIANALSLFGPENTITLAIVDTAGSKALRVTMKDKWTYAGMWLTLPQELNLSNVPVVSYDIYSKDIATWHWNYFYDAHGKNADINRNIQNSGDHQFSVSPNAWTNVSFDYRQPGDLNNSLGNPIDASRINGLLINMHDIKPTWPFTNATGVFYIRNIKFGDKAVYSIDKPVVTVDPVSNFSVYENDGDQEIKVSGLTVGGKPANNITLTAVSQYKNVADVISVSDVNQDGTATIKFSVKAVGQTVITITASAPDATSTAVKSRIYVVKNEATVFSKLIIDKSVKHQTIRGLGTFLPDSRYNDLYSKDLGSSAVRIGIIGNQWEPVNDNEDPNITNMEGFNYNAFDWDQLRELKANGVESFIITSWSPAAWMKRNLSLDHKEQAIAWEQTDNILEPYYYEEFAESMAALVKAMKQEAGIDILAIGLQNEPNFNEPYPSAILGPNQFNELIKVVGDRFKNEGLDNVGFYMAEQVFGIGTAGYTCEDYLTKLQADPIANAYTDFYAVHGYDASGITPGFPNYDRWVNIANMAKAGSNPKETWMTETFIGYTDWSSAINLAGAIHGSLWAGDISLWTNWSFDGMQIVKNVPTSSFYVSKNFFKYIRPGAVRLDSKSDNANLMVTAFENADGKLTIVVINKGTAPSSSRIYGNNLPEVFNVYRTTITENFINLGSVNVNEKTIIFPPQSVITLIAEKSTVALEMNQVADTTVLKDASEVVVPIEGISNGAGNTSGLSLEYANSNGALLTNVSLSSIDANGKATFKFTPVAGQTGTAQIKLTLSNANGEKRIVIFYVFVKEASAINNLNDNLFKVYPNPTSKVLNISVKADEFNEFAISDIAGRIVLQNNFNSNNVSINVNNWNKGIYILRMKGKENSKTTRFVVQ